MASRRKDPPQVAYEPTSGYHTTTCTELLRIIARDRDTITQVQTFWLENSLRGNASFLKEAWCTECKDDLVHEAHAFVEEKLARVALVYADDQADARRRDAALASQLAKAIGLLVFIALLLTLGVVALLMKTP